MSRDRTLLKTIFLLLTILVISSSSLLPNHKVVTSIPNPFPGEEEYLAFSEEMPSPVGGMEGIMKLITYPSIAKKSGIQGKVFVLAYINENGSVHDVKIVKGIGAGCDEAAIDAIKKTKFNPGKNKGTPVKVKFSLTINFKLS